MDNVEGMKQLNSDSIDLTVTSPPYDKRRKYKGYSFDFENVAKQIFRITKIGGIVVWIVSDETNNFCESLTSFKQALYFKEVCGFNVLDTMIYEKLSYPPAYPTLRRFANVFEYMFIFCKGKPNTFHPIQEPKSKNPATLQRKKYNANTSMRQIDGTKIIKPVKDNGKDTKTKTNIWKYIPSGNYANDKFALQHPAVFPEHLAYDHIDAWSNVGDLVLDPFMGSGTTAKMAKKLGRNFIGFEISQEYVDLANERLSSSNLTKLD